MEEEIEEALQVAATCDTRYAGGHGRGAPATAGEQAVRSFRRKLAAFLRDLDGQLTIAEIRAVIDD